MKGKIKMSEEKYLMLHPFSDLARVSSLCLFSHIKQFLSYVKQEKDNVFNGKVDYFEIREQVIEALQRDLRLT